MDNWLLVASVVTLPFVAALSSAVGGRAGIDRDLLARVACGLVGVGFVAALAAGWLVLATRQPGLDAGSGPVRLDPLAVILAILVLGLSGLIQSFAVRYLRGDLRQGWFVTMTNLLTGFTVVLVCAGSVLTFAAAWVAAGAALVLLLATYPSAPLTRAGVRRTAVQLAIGDTAVLSAAAVITVTAGGDVLLDRLGSLLATLPEPVQILVALLLVTGALARSSQIPFHTWLPSTLSAPTPVSALLHAGVVNAGAILLIRFAPAITVHQSVMTVVFLAGAATLVYASAVRMVKPDVKGRLVFSTMAQMGFMVMACGLGAFAAAIFHLIAHSLFKSTLFLGAGMGVRTHAASRDLPVRPPTRRRVVVAAVAGSALLTLGALFAAQATINPGVSPASIGLLLFVAVTGIVTLAVGLATNFSRLTVGLGVLSIVGIGFGYTAFLALFASVLDAEASVAAAPVWMLVLPALGLGAVGLLSRTGRRWGGLRDLAYSRALAASLSPTSVSKGTP